MDFVIDASGIRHRIAGSSAIDQKLPEVEAEGCEELRQAMDGEADDGVG
jgi:hypothetical protein